VNKEILAEIAERLKFYTGKYTKIVFEFDGREQDEFIQIVEPEELCTYADDLDEALLELLPENWVSDDENNGCNGFITINLSSDNPSIDIELITYIPKTIKKTFKLPSKGTASE
jgi:hypothetical protein